MNESYNLDLWISTLEFNYYVSEFHPLFLKVFEAIEKSGTDIENREYLKDFLIIVIMLSKNHA